MSSQPQIPVEEIDLIPHPMDAWRAALNALIAVAPGDSAEIAYHLDEARKCTLICRDFSAASQGEAKLIDRLMLLGASKLVGNRLDAQQKTHNELGFTHHARLIGIDLSAAGPREPQPADRPGTASSGVREAQMPLPANAPTATIALSIQAQATPGSLVQQLCEARREPERESAPRSAAGESLARPSGDSSCR